MHPSAFKPMLPSRVRAIGRATGEKLDTRLGLEITFLKTLTFL